MSLFNELKRRNVFRVGIAYIVIAWLLAQVADLAFENFGTPDWAIKTLLFVLVLGFPLAVFFAWAFELTPEGLKKEKEVDRSQSITHHTGRKLDYTIIAILAVALTYFAYDKFGSKKGSEPFSVESTAPMGEVIEKGSDPILGNSIAVLPFANRSNVEDDLFFTDGIHDDLLTQLAKITGLKVISRTSVMEYRDTTKKIAEIAAELGVTSILEGGVQRAGKRIRINAQLIDVTTDEHLWAETFDREMTVENIFDIQSEITRQIVTAVRGELNEAESEVLSQTPTSNLEAYEAYLHAKTLLIHPDYIQQKFIDAEVWAKKAVQLDPEFALAWALLVETNGQLVWMGLDNAEERIQYARVALDNATRYGPQLAETLAARAEYTYRIENDFHAAEAAFTAASKAKPGDSTLLSRLGIAQRRAGKFEEAVSSFQLAIELDPGGVEARSLLVATLNIMGEFQRAEPLIDLWVEKYPDAQDIKAEKTSILIYHYGDLKAARTWFDELEPVLSNSYTAVGLALPFLERDYQGLIDFWDKPVLSEFRKNKAFQKSMNEQISRAYRYLGNKDKANEHAQMVIDLIDSDTVNDAARAFDNANLALVYAHKGEFQKAVTYSTLATQLMPESEDKINGVYFSNIHAQVLGMAGRREESLAEIERLINAAIAAPRWDLYLNPDWDFFRDDERFNALARPLNLEEDR